MRVLLVGHGAAAAGYGLGRLMGRWREVMRAAGGGRDGELALCVYGFGERTDEHIGGRMFRMYNLIMRQAEWLSLARSPPTETMNCTGSRPTTGHPQQSPEATHKRSSTVAPGSQLHPTIPIAISALPLP
jgi:hypothetical protein